MRRDIVLAASLTLLVGGCGAARTDAPIVAAAVASVEIQVVARGQAFEPAIVRVPSGASVTLRFENADIGLGHALVIEKAGPPATRFARAAPTVGPDVETYVLPAFAAGEYRIACAIHAGMAARLIAS